MSGTGLYRVAGLGALLVGGSLDVAKGCVGPLLAGPDRPLLADAAGGMAVVGHNWSVVLGGAGGRGISPSMGSMLVNGWQGSVHLLVMLAAGKLSRATSLGAFIGYLTLGEVLVRARGRRGRRTAAFLVVPMLVKRIMGNVAPTGPSAGRVRLVRLVFDQDTPQWRWWMGDGS